MTRLIGISGKIGAGKDTVAKALQNILTYDTGKHWEVKKYAGKLREVASILTGIPADDFENREVKDRWLPQYNMTVREFLQKLGTDAIRNNIHDYAWIIALFNTRTESDNWIISDMRFKNEARAVKNSHGILLRINRPGSDVGTHPSETDLDGYAFDYVIENDGTIEDLIKKVHEFVEHLKNKEA